MITILAATISTDLFVCGAFVLGCIVTYFVMSLFKPQQQYRTNSNSGTTITGNGNMVSSSGNNTICSINNIGRQSVIINGSAVECTTLKLIADGVFVSNVSVPIKINIQGNCNTVDLTSGDVQINGNAQEVGTVSGDIDVTGNVTGDVETISGDVSCGKVGGKVSTLSGDVRHK